MTTRSSDDEDGSSARSSVAPFLMHFGIFCCFNVFLKQENFIHVHSVSASGTHSFKMTLEFFSFLNYHLKRLQNTFAYSDFLFKHFYFKSGSQLNMFVVFTNIATLIVCFFTMKSPHWQWHPI